MASPHDDAASGPRDPELWYLTLAAVKAAGTIADTQLAQGGWRPRVAVPEVRSFDSGWPNLSRSRLFPPDDAPTEFSALFGLTRDNLRPIEYADVPEIVALIDYVNACEDLLPRLAVATASGDVGIEERMFAYEVADLPLSLLDRSRAIDATTDADLLALYLERERAWLVDPLPVEYVVPLALTALDLDAALTIDDSTRIEPLDSAWQAARAPGDYSVGGVPSAVVSAATHAIVLRGSQLVNPGPGPRIFARHDEPLPLDEADLVCQALRIVSDIEVGYAQVLRRPLGWTDTWDHDLPPMTTVGTVRRYPEWFDDFGWLRQPKSIGRAELQHLPEIVTALRAAPAHVALAARRLSLAATRPADDDRTVDACIGLEALLGEGRDELSHRLALRAATALATRAEAPADPRTIYDLVKRVYAHRSAVVHGARGDRTRTLTLHDREYQTADVAVVLLRAVLTDALRRPGGWTPSSLDATLLGALGRREEPSEDGRSTDDD